MLAHLTKRQAGVIHSDHVEQAMLLVDRSNYAPRNAYTDAPQPIGHQASVGKETAVNEMKLIDFFASQNCPESCRFRPLKHVGTLLAYIAFMTTHWWSADDTYWDQWFVLVFSHQILTAHRPLSARPTCMLMRWNCCPSTSSQARPPWYVWL